MYFKTFFEYKILMNLDTVGGITELSIFRAIIIKSKYQSKKLTINIKYLIKIYHPWP